MRWRRSVVECHRALFLHVGQSKEGYCSHLEHAADFGGRPGLSSNMSVFDPRRVFAGNNVFEAFSWWE